MSSSSDSCQISAVLKSPASLLEELCNGCGVIPIYNLTREDTGGHDHIFEYRVTVGNFMATGLGQSKKKAKHCAANTVLEVMRQCQLEKERGDRHQQANNVATCMGLPEGLKNVSLKELVVNIATTGDDGIESNPVCELQHLCRRRKMPAPVYEICPEDGNVRFKIICRVGNHQETGFGYSKKAAKRLSAFKMLTWVKSSENRLEHHLKSNEDKTKRFGYANLRSEMVCCKRNHVGTMHTTMLNQILQMTEDDMEIDPIGTLEKFGQEMNVEVSYIQSELKSTDGKYHTLVRVKLEPVAVCFGTGISKESSQVECALQFLRFFQAMIRN